MTAKGTILEVKRFSVHDGPGVRTTLFLKGCPLRCLWCHNPEGIAPQPQLAYYAHKCINCGECVAVCPAHAHSLSDGVHHFDRIKCRACGACEPVCLGNALRLYGKSVTVEQAMELVLEDRDFYGAHGGVTLSGGEPLIQPEFCHELLSGLKREGIHTALDTCGCVTWDIMEKMMPLTDIWLYDMKHADSARHRQLTGKGNELIVANLRRLADAGARIEVRIPLIPGCNCSTEELRTIGKLLGEMRIEAIKVLPYHAMARNKYAALNMRNMMPTVTELNENTLHQAVTILRNHGVNAVSGEE